MENAILLFIIMLMTVTAFLQKKKKPQAPILTGISTKTKNE